MISASASPRLPLADRAIHSDAMPSTKLWLMRRVTMCVRLLRICAAVASAYYIVRPRRRSTVARLSRRKKLPGHAPRTSPLWLPRYIS